MSDHDFPALAAWATAAAERVSGGAATVLQRQADALTHAGQMAADLAALRAERDALAARVEALEEALQIAAAVFDRYAELHQAKGTREAAAKAHANAELANQMRAAVRASGEDV